MFGGKGAIELLAAITADDPNFGLRNRSPNLQANRRGADVEARWRKACTMALSPRAPSPVPSACASHAALSPADAGPAAAMELAQTDDSKPCSSKTFPCTTAASPTTAGFRDARPHHQAAPGQRGAYEPFCRQVRGLSDGDMVAVKCGGPM